MIVWGSETWKWLRQFLQNGCLYQCWTGIKNIREYYLSIIWVSLFNLSRYHFEWYPDWKPDHWFSGMKLLRGLVVDLSIDDALQWCSCFCYYSFASSQISHCCRNCGWSCLYPEWHCCCFHSCLQWWCFVCGFAFLQIWE